MEMYLRFKTFYFKNPTKKTGPLKTKSLEKTKQGNFFFLKFENHNGKRIDLKMRESYFKEWLASKLKMMKKNEIFKLKISPERYTPQLSYKGGYNLVIENHTKIPFFCFTEEKEQFPRVYEENINDYEIKTLSTGEKYKNTDKNSTYLVFGDGWESFVSLKRIDLVKKNLEFKHKITIFDLKKQDKIDKGGWTLVLKETKQTKTDIVQELKKEIRKKEKRTRFVYKQLRAEQKENEKLKRQNDILKNKLKKIMVGKTLQEQEQILDRLTT